MSEVKYILDPIENKGFRILADDLNIFCEDLGLYVRVEYTCSPKREINSYELVIFNICKSKYSEYCDDYVWIRFYPDKDLYSVTLYNINSIETKEFLSTDESANDIYDLITNHIKKCLED